MKKRQKIVGVLGGLGPKTTAVFYLDLVKTAERKRRPAVSIWSVPIDRRKENEYIASGVHTGHYLRELTDGAQRLVNAGADFIVIPCNTVHEFHSTLSQSVSVPIPHLIKIVAQEVLRRGWRKVLLLATSRTLQTRLYQNMLGKSGIEIRMPEPHEQEKLDALIQRALSENTTEDDRKFLESLREKSEVEEVLLGCTDLQLLCPPSKTVIDSMQELVLHTAKILTSESE